MGQGAGKPGKGSKNIDLETQTLKQNNKTKYNAISNNCFYQCMGPLEQEAKVDLDLAITELVQEPMVLVQELMAQDH